MLEHFTLSGTKVRCAQVQMDVDEAGAPTHVARVIPYYLMLDEDGDENVQAAVDAAADNTRAEAAGSDLQR